MAQIALLSQETIDKIAAGEVIERPGSVVKELVENAIDAGATAVTVEIRDGGTSLIRITDNGCGIVKDQVALAFLRHSTSKIQRVEDLLTVRSLGFRGEALSSIAAVARVELITKTHEQLTGTRYVIEGSREIACEEVGAPDGTTFLVKDLFYNTPARKKFLRTPQTEGNHISDLVEKLALSHPDISFKYINNNQTKLHTSGNGNCKDLIYHIFGRDITSSLLKVDYKGDYFQLSGYIGKPVITRGNRNLENYFINQRYIKSSLIAKAIEEAYKGFIMQHQYPFTVLYFTFDGELLDVNVHPTKMELRFGHNQEIYRELCDAIHGTLAHRDLIPEVPVDDEKQNAVPKRVYPETIPEPFEKRRINDVRRNISNDTKQDHKPENTKLGDALGNSDNSGVRLGMGVREDTKVYRTSHSATDENPNEKQASDPMKSGQSLTEVEDRYAQKLMDTKETGAEIEKKVAHRIEEIRNQLLKQQLEGERQTDHRDADQPPIPEPEKPIKNPNEPAHPKENLPKQAASKKGEQYEEITLASISPDFMTQEARANHRIIGQLFDTYWLIEYEEKLYIIDQHAAHEKVLYEKTMARLAQKDFTSQMISPPIVLSLDAIEIEMLEKYRRQIEQLGYVVEHFGGKEYMISAVPDNLFHMDMKDLFIEMLDDFSNLSGKDTPQLILEKVASMSCKAAVKGNNKMSLPEVEELITELLSLENPYNCPHGRPTIISMTKYEIEKKFKRIV